MVYGQLVVTANLATQAASVLRLCLRLPFLVFLVFLFFFFSFFSLLLSRGLPPRMIINIRKLNNDNNKRYQIIVIMVAAGVTTIIKVR